MENNSAEFNILMDTMNRAIAASHGNALALRETTTNALALHKAMRMVEDEMARNHRRFQMEALVEEAADFNLHIRQLVVKHKAELNQILELGKLTERVTGEDMSVHTNELHAAMVRLNRVAAELDYVDQAVIECNSKIAQMV